VSDDKTSAALGAFVTNKWMVGTMLALIMSMGGYIFHGIDKGNEVAAAQLQALERRTVTLEIELARTDARYNEIIRRLDRIEAALYSRGH
jgi:hypothetical protein